MAIRVLVVDDSRFFRRRVTEILESDSRIKVIGSAENGSEAVQKSTRLKPDVITMDIEMPVMDGISATRRILSTQKIPILMFSSLTTEGAQSTLDALEAGAVDYLPKRFEDISKDKDVAKRQLCEKVLAVAKQIRPAMRTVPTQGISATKGNRTIQHPMASAKTNAVSAKSTAIGGPVINRRGQYNYVVIGTSTGGPVALQNVLTKLPKDFSRPILLIQHMPGSFTTAFAQRLDKACSINVKEAQEGDELSPGMAYLAPGGKQMELKRKGRKTVIHVQDANADQTYKPCVDITLKSVAKIEPAKTLAIIMTGMGADGCEGAKTLKHGGATIWAQDEASSVVYGMPAAVAEAGIADNILSLEDIGTNLAHKV